MKIKIFPWVTAIIWLLDASPAFSQGTAFTYQGRLNDGGNLAAGVYDLRFTIFDSATNPVTVIAGPITNSATGTTNGLFTVTLDFGANVFTGPDRWLEIGVRTNGGGVFSPLNPRQKLTPVPYAILAENLAPGAGLSGIFSNAVNLSNPGNQFTGDGSGLANVSASTVGGLSTSNFWQLSGNSSTKPANNFIGTKDLQALEFRANNVRGWRLEPTVDAPNIIGNPVVNFAGPGLQGVTIGGGGSIATYGAAYPNSVSAASGTIGGGLGNTIQFNAFESTIAGGNQNIIQSNSFRSTIGGGYSNVIQQGSPESSIGGGSLNIIQPAADRSVIGGGQGNVIVGSAALPVLAIIGGGDQNMTGTNSTWSTIGGGRLNLIEGYENSTTIAGGEKNVIHTNCSYATISGGIVNSIGPNAGNAAIAGGGGNDNQAAYGTIGGGQNNTIQGGASSATISGGSLNAVGPGAADSGIAGGVRNTNQAGASFIGGGQLNLIIPSGFNAVIGGGYSNYIAGNTATIGGGTGNSASNNDGTIGGGRSNTAGGSDSTVGGGENNTASGDHSTVPGGRGNTASGASSFAAGQDAWSAQDHTFIWGDGSHPVVSSGPNRFEVLATGGVTFNTGSNRVGLIGSGSLDFGSTTRQMLNLYGFAYGIGVQNLTLYNRTAANGVFSWFQGGVHSNNQGDPGAGGSEVMRLDNSGSLLVHGSVTANVLFVSSDRNLKAQFETVDARAILEKVAAMPITRWRFTNEMATPHLGPMAQDFQAAFNLGRDDTHISVVDEGGVALAAIQGLNQKVEAKEAEIQDLKARLEKLERSINKKNGSDE